MQEVPSWFVSDLRETGFGGMAGKSLNSLPSQQWDGKGASVRLCEGPGVCFQVFEELMYPGVRFAVCGFPRQT